MNDTTGLAEGQVRFNGTAWQIVRQGQWVMIETPEIHRHEIEVEFYE